MLLGCSIELIKHQNLNILATFNTVYSHSNEDKYPQYFRSTPLSEQKIYVEIVHLFINRFDYTGILADCSKLKLDRSYLF